jgi:hypothetical protein
MWLARVQYRNRMHERLLSNITSVKWNRPISLQSALRPLPNMILVSYTEQLAGVCFHGRCVKYRSQIASMRLWGFLHRYFKFKLVAIYSGHDLARRQGECEMTRHDYYFSIPLQRYFRRCSHTPPKPQKEEVWRINW